LGVIAAFGGLCWFATFAIADSALRLVPRGMFEPLSCVLLVAFVCALLDLLAAPDIALTFGVLAALGLGAIEPPPESAWARSVPGRVAPLLAAGALTAGFVVHVFLPTVQVAAEVREARLAARAFEVKRRAVEKAAGAAKTAARADAIAFTRRAILTPLARAVRADPHEAGPLLEQVPWWLTVWELGAPPGADENAVIAAAEAQARDPEGVAGYLAEFRVRLRFAELSATKRKEQFDHTNALIDAIVARDPAREARLRYQLARVAFAVKEDAVGRAAAAAALKLDADAPGPRYRLSDDEREWLKTKEPPADADKR
jgi:hypothetical protein